MHGLLAAHAWLQAEPSTCFELIVFSCLAWWVVSAWGQPGHSVWPWGQISTRGLPHFLSFLFLSPSASHKLKPNMPLPSTALSCPTWSQSVLPSNISALALPLSGLRDHEAIIQMGKLRPKEGEEWACFVPGVNSGNSLGTENWVPCPIC